MSHYFSGPSTPAVVSLINVFLNLLTLGFLLVLGYYCYHFMRRAADLLDVTKRYIELVEDIVTATGAKIDTTKDEIKQTIVDQGEIFRRAVRTFTRESPP